MQSFGKLLRQARGKEGLRLQDLADRVLAQLAMALHLPADLLYFALGKLPPDRQVCEASEEQVLVALQALPQLLVSSS